MLKKLLIILIIALSSMHLLDVQANTNVLSQLPKAVQQRLYERLNNQEDDTITETKLTNSDGASSDQFGFSVAIDGTTFVVGAYMDDDKGDSSGSVYVYDLTQDINGEGFERKITASDGAENDNFGYSVSIDGTTLVVGAGGDDDKGDSSGSVYVYDLTLDGNAAINDTPATPYASGFERKITASDGASGDLFGQSVAIDGTTLVAAARHDNDNGSNSGSVYVYDLTLDGNVETTGNPATSYADGFERKINASDGAANDDFGLPVAIDGTTLVVGAYLDDDNGSNSGSVYVYDLTLDGNVETTGNPATSYADGFERKINASDSAANDNFGRSVAIDGTTFVVGAYNDDDNGSNSGSVYVYDLTLDGNVETTGNPATSYADGFERKINASDGAANDNFGFSVAIDGTTLVVGAFLDDDNSSNSGSVYVYDVTLDGNAAINDTPATPYASGFEREITASDGAASDYFGFSVAIDGTTLVVGAFAADTNGVALSGAVYIYNGTFGSGNAEAEDPITETKLISSDGSSGDYFGYSVALNGTTLVIGASREGGNGAVYVYDLTKDSNEVGFERKITASDGAYNDIFGKSVAIDGTTLVVGSDSDDDNDTNTGSVYVYDLTKTPEDDGFERKITASDGASTDYFGFTVSIQNTTVVVGTYNANKVYVYDLNKNSGEEGFERIITASDGSVRDYFGKALDLYNSTLVVGAWADDNNGTDSGSVYVYDLTKTPEDDGFETKITASDGASNDYFGDSVAIDGTTLVVGAYGDDDNDTNTGSVYVYDLTKTPEDDGFETKITASDGEKYDNYGTAVALNGTTLVVGAHYAEDKGRDSGSAYVYDLNKTSDDEGFETKITASDGAEYDYFGYSVAIDGDTLIVGSYRDDDNTTDSGSVYIYNGTFGSGTSKTDEEWASEITTMIDALTPPYDINTVEAAREAYDALTETQQALVTNYQDLLDAEAEIADQVAAAAVDAMIDALTDPLVSDDVAAARAAYDALTETQQALVTNYQDLLNAEAEIADQVAAAAVDALIDAFTDPLVSDDVAAAREAYNNLTESQQALVTGLPDLEAAEQTLIDIAAAAQVDALIDAFTDPLVSDDVAAAREAYNNLTESQQALVTGLPDLEAAEQTLIDIAAAAQVDALIDAFTDPLVSDDVAAAREAYNNLTESQQALVTNYQDLLNAEQTLADIAAAAQVDALIDAFTDPLVSDDVAAAREAYNNLTESQQALVTNYQDLLNAEQTLADIAAAAAVDALIDALSEPYDVEAVQAARTAYDNLTESQQALVTNYQDLLNAEQALVDIDAAAEVDAMIDALTSPYEATDVKDAREAYDNLTEDQQALVTNYQVLLNAEQTLIDIAAAAQVDALIDAFTDPLVSDDVAAAREAYNNLTESQQALVTGLPDLEAAEQTLIDIAAAAQVDALIDAFTDPLVSDDVAAAREAYNNLTESQQALVTGLPDLEAAEQTLIDIAAAAQVDALIDAFTDPLVSDDVAAAREAYNNLTESQQALVTGLPDLEAAEQTLADIDAAAEVDAMIDALTSPYEATDVKDAREAYDNLTEDQQALVTGLTQLEIAEAELNDQLNAQAAAEVDALIQTLSEEATEEDVEAAREAYEALTPEQQALVTELPTLETYENQVEPSSIFGSLLIILIVIAGISAVIYFGFYKRQKEEPKIEQKKAEPKTSNQEHPKDDLVSKAFIEKELITLRERLQKKYDYAEFFIYSDEQLKELIKAQPKTKAEFLKVKGFGEKKYKNFGKEVIQLFKTYKLK